ncbi:hypothetical protein AXF42_Ash019933 [Apostasia shenzhenica]|uniref:Uncharacterized protein n=1 Tax=Apostasia shenzhenica TaxID=1088818 RepID=A0A2H9ZYZ7_9ASPA|nr:hypothetical protein AXF42_Ash019933 [Apostasia shenzhenica]
MAVHFIGRGLSTLPIPSRHLLSFQLRRAAARAAFGASEIRVCVNRSCGRQGSREMLEILTGMAPADIAVSSCGCLGRCGAGPNFVVLPGGSIVGHCGTAARAVQLLADICGADFDPRRNLEALYLRKRAEVELEKGNAFEAAALLTQAIELIPSGGLHFIFKIRSTAKLRMGDNNGALEDAKEACNIAADFPEAYICRGDALLAMGDLDEADKAYTTALDIDPSIRRSKSFKDFKFEISPLLPHLRTCEPPLLQEVAGRTHTGMQVLYNEVH